jgi:hypothetical protein
MAGQLSRELRVVESNLRLGEFERSEEELVPAS